MQDLRYPSRNIDPGVPVQYRGLQMSEQLHRVYLDELPLEPEQSLGIKMAELVVVDREAAIEQSRQLIQQMQVDAIASGFQENVLKLIQAVIVYKLGYLRSCTILNWRLKLRLYKLNQPTLVALKASLSLRRQTLPV